MITSFMKYRDASDVTHMKLLFVMYICTNQK